MRTYRYEIVDVFTETRFEGNPLAVVHDARGLDDATMQRITREFNLSETVFFSPPTDPATVARLRIFMPEHEIPFAGHPTIGAAFVAVRSGLVAPDATGFALHENVGSVPIRLASREPFLAWFETPPMHAGARPDRLGIATALSLDADDLLAVPPEVASAGNEFVYVAVRSPEVVDRVVADIAAFRREPVLAASEGAFVFAPVATGVYARMLAPLCGVPEDPATGSATGPLGLYMTRHGLAPLRDGYGFVNEQGVRMGRRSLIRATLRVKEGALVTVEVGGGAVPVMSGELTA